MQHRLSNLIKFCTIRYTTDQFIHVQYHSNNESSSIKNHNSKPERKTVWEMFLFVQPYNALTAYYS